MSNSPETMNNVMPYMHTNGFSTVRNAVVEVMRVLKLDEYDWRLRDKLIFAASPWIQKEAEARVDAGKTGVGIANPCEELAHVGWQFSAYESPESWQVWAKHPLGGACQIAELQKIGRTGFDVKATAEAFAEFLSRKGE